MAVVISGILKDGAGKPVQGCIIQMKAKRTSPTVVVEVTSSDITGADGSYRIQAEPGYYSVSLLREGFPPAPAGEIYVAPSSNSDTLNAFLGAPEDGDLRPEALKRFEEMVNRTATLCNEATQDRDRAERAVLSAEQSRDSAALSATAAGESGRLAEQSADAAEASARVADENARQVAQDVKASGASAESAARSAQAAKEQVGLAKTAADTAQKAQRGAETQAHSAAGSAGIAQESERAAGESAGRAAASESAVRESALAATEAARESKASASAAALSERTAEKSAVTATGASELATTKAEESAESARRSAESAALVGEHESTAAQSAKDAGLSARDAKAAAGSVSGFIDHLSVSTRYSVTDANRQLSVMRIASGRYEGLWRYLNHNGGINWYFLFLAIYESEGKAFSLSDRMTVCEKALRLGLVVPFMAGCRYESGQRLMINGLLFFVNIEGTTGTTVPDTGAVQSGGFIYTGSAVLECLGSPEKNIPSSWEWFFADVSADLRSPVAPDSTDSYSSLWFACVAEFADSDWLQAPSGIGDYTRWHILKRVAECNITRQMNTTAGLVNVFQGNQAPGGRDYAQCFCQDNAEVYSGLRALVCLAGMVEDTDAASQYSAAMKTIKQGLLALFVPEQNRFKTYYNETDYPEEPGDARFVQKDRFSVAPWRFGVLETRAELEQYGWPVLNAIQAACPDLFTANYAGIDTFAMSDFFAFVAKVTASQAPATTALRRLQIRKAAAITVSDIAAAISVSPWGIIPHPRPRDFMRINGKSVFHGENINLGAAAEKDIQADIHDRTKGRLAIPGAFGYGAYFSSTKYFSAITGPTEFLKWVKDMQPGRYIVAQYGNPSGDYNPIIEGVVFQGMVEISVPEMATPDDHHLKVKLVEFRGVNGNIYVNRLWKHSVTGYYLTGWESLNPGSVRDFGAIGTYALMIWSKTAEFRPGGFEPGTPVSGSNLVWVNNPGAGETQGLSVGQKGPTGTWRAHAHIGSADQIALFYRIL